LPVIESLVERQEAGEDVGLLTDGWVNFFFVFVGEKKEKEDEKPAVLVVYIRRLGSRWRMRLNWLGYGRVLDEGSRFFFRNSGSR
jgi:hypothetical protein